MRSILSRLGRAVLLLATFTVLVVAGLRVLPPPTTAFLVEDAVTRGEFPSWDWRPASKISPWLFVAVVASEDQNFAVHWGFDFGAIEKAVRHNDRGGSVRGASTISQQVAKNLFLWPGRSLVRKGLEAALTVMIEQLWPKSRILEVYANVAEFGDGVFGAEAASRRYFHHDAASLSLQEAALLAATLPDPHGYHPDAPSPQLRRRQQWIVKQAGALGGEAWLRKIRM